VRRLRVCREYYQCVFLCLGSESACHDHWGSATLIRSSFEQGAVARGVSGWLFLFVVATRQYPLLTDSNVSILSSILSQPEAVRQCVNPLDSESESARSELPADCGVAVAQIIPAQARNNDSGRLARASGCCLIATMNLLRVASARAVNPHVARDTAR
jgi:hypothetical protein